MTQQEVIAKAIYEAPGVERPWDTLPAERRQGWLEDAARVITVLECADCGSPVTGRKSALDDAVRVVEHWSLPTIQTPSMWLIDKAGIAAEIRRLDEDS